MQKSAKQAASELHKRIWRERHQIWGDQVPFDPVDMLDPRIAIELLDYAYESLPEIGPWPPDKYHAIAGMVDPSRKQVTVAERFGLASGRFTAAHELGHILLHPGTSYRERAIAGPRTQLRDPKEREADAFATEFLMPENLLRRRVKDTFGVEPPIEIRDTEAFWMDMTQPDVLLQSLPNSLELAQALAKCQRNFQGDVVTSLKGQFKVSIEAMAYRLQELKVI